MRVPDVPGISRSKIVDDRQITHLICARPKHDLYDFLRGCFGLSAPQRCNAQRSDAQRKFFTTLSISLFLQRHRCDALPCFSASPVEIFYIAHIALRPLLPFFLSRQWFTVQNNKKFAKSHNAAMSPLATRDGQRNAQRTTQRCGALRFWGLLYKRKNRKQPQNTPKKVISIIF